jgi:predicted transcriptional regulator
MEATSSATQNLFVALGHPTRRQILREMDGGPPASPRELTELLGDTLSNVSYHFRVLAQAGVLKLVSTRPVRGSPSTSTGCRSKPSGRRRCWRSTSRRSGRAIRGGKRSPDR